MSVLRPSLQPLTADLPDGFAGRVLRIVLALVALTLALLFAGGADASWPP